MSVLALFFSSCAIEMALHHSRVRNNPMCECRISVTGCGHISYSWPGESRILPTLPQISFDPHSPLSQTPHPQLQSNLALSFRGGILL